MAQMRVLNDTLSISSPYLIAKNNLLGTVEPTDASRVTILGLFRYSSDHEIHDDHRIRTFSLSILVVVSHLDHGNLEKRSRHCSMDH